MRVGYAVLVVVGLGVAAAPGLKDKPAVVAVRVDSGRPLFEVSPAFVPVLHVAVVQDVRDEFRKFLHEFVLTFFRTRVQVKEPSLVRN